MRSQPEGLRENAVEAASLLRKLVSKIGLKSDAHGDGLLIDLHGNLAGILTLAAKTGKSLNAKGMPDVQDKLVAGVRNTLNLSSEFDSKDKLVAGARSSRDLLELEIPMSDAQKQRVRALMPLFHAKDLDLS